MSQHDLIRLDVNGTTRTIPNGYPSVREAIGGTIDFTTLTDKVGAYVDDEGLVKRLPMNVVGSLLAGRPLYGPLVFGAIDPDRDGDTCSPDEQTMRWAESIGQRWNFVVLHCSQMGTDPYPYGSDDDLPPPMIIEGDDVDAFWRLIHGEGDPNI